MFVIPNHIHLSRSQNTILISSGQQRGVPFSLNEQGASRPETNCVKVKYTYGHVKLIKNSVKLVNAGDAKYILQFQYSSALDVDTQVIIFVNAKDKSTPHNIR